MSAALVRVVSPEGPVAQVWLNRPDKKNALTLEMLDDLVAAGRALAKQPGLRAIVLAGEGGDFCSGLDTGVLESLAGDLDRVKGDMLTPADPSGANRFQLPATIWQTLPVPVIAALEGVCFGGGAQIALGADFRIAHPDALISIMEGKWGLIPDMGISQSLPRLLSADRAMELILTARVLRSTEAQQLGLITRLSDAPVEEALRFAEALAGRSPEAIRAGKRLVETIYSGNAITELRLEAELQAALIGTPNQIEAVSAAAEGRMPRYC
ncbi:crotonase/enoyl-CoA hydratase family protein [Tropicimonas sp. IMCC34043]|uniref:crotonase/enoyl-CoA hydratase family protein n=1 Tax=Tropicimonas sp. IMCC34043 TaxID=2248760 RepID=UPI000E27CEB1|nr:crotonase/enoyl-CoA hydratase family protein [Tropicimonas sp. IMCC34043]